MKLLFLLILLIFLNGCSNNVAYWCGDHQCIDNQEKSEYFKKNMIMEVKNVKKNKKNKKSEYEKILTQSQQHQKNTLLYNKDLSKIAKLEEKFRIKEEKRLAKELRLKEKKRIKNERKLAKINKKNKKKKNKKIKVSKKKVVRNKILKNDKTFEQTIKNSNSFSDLVKDIQERNYNRPFPDINEIPF
jgi:hypothetical protein